MWFVNESVDVEDDRELDEVNDSQDDDEESDDDVESIYVKMN